jgi:hypothetical protein
MLALFSFSGIAIIFITDSFASYAIVFNTDSFAGIAIIFITDSFGSCWSFVEFFIVN